MRNVVKVLLPGVALACAASSLCAAERPLNTLPAESAFSALQWRGIGPFRGGRAVAVAGVPGSPNVFYFGAAAGGVWKTIDAGATWKPIFDGVRASSIGAIAVARSNPNIIYVGTGEGNLRGDVTWGGGVFKSTDAGATWTDIGLTDTRQIGAVIVDPANVVTAEPTVRGVQEAAPTLGLQIQRLNASTTAEINAPLLPVVPLSVAYT